MISNQKCCYCNKFVKCYTLRSEENTLFFVCLDCFINKIGKDFQLCPYCEKIYMAHGKEKCDICVVLTDINPYHYKPQSIFYNMSDENTELFVGIELEINFDTIKNLANFIRCNKNEFCYFKHDGSIGGNGVEIVSHPATFIYHLKNNMWKRMFEFFDKVTDTKNCGLHFHLSKKYFNDKEITLLDKLINKYPYIASQIGSRKLAGYCALQNYSTKFGLDRNCKSHTDACNLLNPYTIELRFCKSTNNYSTFIKKIKMIYILIMFVKNIYKYNYDVLIDDDNNKQFLYKAFEHFKGELLSRI